MIDEKKIYNYIKEQINPYGKPFTGTVYEFGLKIMDYIENMEKVGEWIPIKYHETTDDDGIDKNIYPLFLDCKMPDNGQDILICTKGGLICYDTCFDDDGYYLDSSFDWIDDVVAWQPLPEPYNPGMIRKHSNADKIRAMSDEELAEFLMKDMPCDLDTTRCDVYCIDGTQNCKKCIMDWLQSEVEVSDER